MKLKSGWCLLVCVIAAVQLCIVDAQRVSLMDRLKALDKGLRHGLQRQRSEANNATGAESTPSEAKAEPTKPIDASSRQEPQQQQQQSQPLVGSKPVETKGTSPLKRTEIPAASSHNAGPMQHLKPEDNEGASDVVRQLTESFEQDDANVSFTLFNTIVIVCKISVIVNVNLNRSIVG